MDVAIWVNMKAKLRRKEEREGKPKLSISLVRLSRGLFN